MANDPLPISDIATLYNVPYVQMAHGRLRECLTIALSRRPSVETHPNSEGPNLVLVDTFFDSPEMMENLRFGADDVLLAVDTSAEPSTRSIDQLKLQATDMLEGKVPLSVIGLGGGSVLDTAKAISNLYGNPGSASEFQGWDLLHSPGIHKVGIPTISGTGAESSRTCVLVNYDSGIKLGMNSRFSTFDEIILDTHLTKTVSPEQYFFTAMDTFAHCFESQRGRYRNPLADLFSRVAIDNLRDVFSSEDMMSDDARSKMMLASYLGGVSLAGSYVGLVHPLSSALSVVFGSHHGVANCMVMRAMKPYYPDEYNEFWHYVRASNVEIPYPTQEAITPETMDKLISATLIHDKPLSNALGVNFRSTLTDQELTRLFYTIIEG